MARGTDAIDVLANDGRRPTSRRLVTLVGLTLAAVVGVGLVLDHRARTDEVAALDRCASRVADVVTFAEAPVVAMSGYVRPTLENTPPERLRRALYDMVSGVAAGAATRLGPVRSQCERVSVLRTHQDLRARRTTCLMELDRHAAYLRSVVRDGRQAFVSAPSVTRC